MSSNIDRLVQLQLQLHEWKEEDLNNYKRKIALQQKEVTEATGSSSEEISAIGQNSPKRSKCVCVSVPLFLLYVCLSELLYSLYPYQMSVCLSE